MIMKKLIIIFILYYCLLKIVSGQVQTQPLPSPGFEERIHKAVYELRIIDSHEHMMSEKETMELNGDIGCLFNNYQLSDLISSGLEGEGATLYISLRNLESKLRSKDLSPDEKWDLIKTHWESIKATGYGRMIHIAARDLFGISDLNENTQKELSENIAKLRERDDYFEYIMKKMAKIDLSINIGFNDDPQVQDKRYFKSLFVVPGFQIDNYDQVITLCKRYDLLPANTLSEYEEALGKIIRQEVFVNGAIGIKVNMAYNRTLQCDNVPREKALGIFEKIHSNPETKFPFDEIKPLQDYLLFQVFAVCEKYNLPIQIHTGLQTFNGNYITNSRPTGLVEAFFKFPKAKFVLLHASYPYGGELATLAKNFPNVYIDLAWSAIISPSYTVRYIREFIETVPVNKIIAFGGDCKTPEQVYAASIMARETVEKAMVQMVRGGYITENEASEIIVKLLRTNAIEIYGLGKYLK
jgi:hypothetical protein